MCWSAFQIISHMRQQLKLFHPLEDFSSCKRKWGVGLLQYRVQATLLSNIHKCKELHTYIYICNYITHITHIYTYSVDVSKCNIPIAFGHPDGSQWLEAGQMERYLIPPSCTSFTGSQNWMMGKSAGNPRNHYNSW